MHIRQRIAVFVVASALWNAGCADNGGPQSQDESVSQLTEAAADDEALCLAYQAGAISADGTPESRLTLTRCLVRAVTSPELDGYDKDAR